jgi:polyhydroxyalkanoate synthesis regulator phasin
MDVRPTAEIDELRKRIAELETELSMIVSPLAAIEELRKRVADIETDIAIGM